MNVFRQTFDDQRVYEYKDVCKFNAVIDGCLCGLLILFLKNVVFYVRREKSVLEMVKHY